MLIKVKSGDGMRMAHEGKWFTFNKGETKDYPESLLSAFRGVLVSAEQVAETPIIYRVARPSSQMPIIKAEQPKIKIPSKKNTKKKIKRRKV